MTKTYVVITERTEYVIKAHSDLEAKCKVATDHPEEKVVQCIELKHGVITLADVWPK